MKGFMAMVFILMVSGVCRAASLDADLARWADLKEADQRMAADYAAALKARGYNDDDPPVDKVFREINRQISYGQAYWEKAQNRLCDAIDAQASRGTIDSEKVRELKSRVVRVFTARRYSLWGNLWRRCVLEGFGDDSPIPHADNVDQLLGKRLALAISDTELVQIVRENEFDLAAYGIDSDYFHPIKPLDLSVEDDDSRGKADAAAVKQAGDRVNQTTSDSTFRP